MSTPRKCHSKGNDAAAIAMAGQQCSSASKRLDADQKRLSILEEELKRAYQEKQQSLDLLVATKEMFVDQENSMEKLREENKRLEQVIAQLEDQLDRKKGEFEKCTKRYNTIESDFEGMLLEKDVKINELKGRLGFAQARCNQLEPQVIHQQQRIKEMEAMIASFEKTVALVNRHSDGVQAELNSIDALLLKDQTCVTPLVGGGSLSPADRIDHLHRALDSPKDMADEIFNLQKLLRERDRSLQLLREKQTRSLGEIAELRADKTQLGTRIMCMQGELGELQLKAINYVKLQEKIQPLIAERDALRERHLKSDSLLKRIQVDVLRLNQNNENLRQKCDQLTEDDWKLQQEVDRLSRLQWETSRDNESLKEKLSQLRDVAQELEEQREENANLRGRMQLVETRSEQLAKRLRAERDGLWKELQAWQASQATDEGAPAAAALCSKCLEQLNDGELKKISKRKSRKLKELLLAPDGGDQLDITAKQDSFLSELKGNVQQFKEYLKTKNGHENAELHQRRDGVVSSSVSTWTELSLAHVEQMEQRSQMAEELMAFSSQSDVINQKYQALLSNYKEVRDKLQERLKDIDRLQCTVVEERARSESIVNAKNDELAALLREYRDKERLVADLQRGFDDAFSNIASERQTMKTVMQTFEAEKVEISEVEKYWQDKLAALQTEHEEALQTSQQHYRAALQTANNYRLYAEEKSKEYKESMGHMKHTLKQHLAEVKRRSSSQPRSSQPAVE